MTKTTKEYPENSDWGRDDKETEQQMGAIQRGLAERQEREAKEMDARASARRKQDYDAAVAAAHKARDPFTRARIMHAHLMKVESLPTPTAGSQPHTYPGVKALVFAHSLMAVAGDDAEMRLWASDIEWGARSRIRLHLGWEDDGVVN